MKKVGKRGETHGELAEELGGLGGGVRREDLGLGRGQVEAEPSLRRLARGGALLRGERAQADHGAGGGGQALGAERREERGGLGGESVGGRRRLHHLSGGGVCVHRESTGRAERVGSRKGVLSVRATGGRGAGGSGGNARHEEVRDLDGLDRGQEVRGADAEEREALPEAERGDGGRAAADAAGGGGGGGEVGVVVLERGAGDGGCGEGAGVCDR